MSPAASGQTLEGKEAQSRSVVTKGKKLFRKNENVYIGLLVPWRVGKRKAGLWVIPTLSFTSYELTCHSPPDP